MSFVTAVRDYIDWINSSFDAFSATFGGPMTTWAFFQSTLLYLLSSIKVGVLYVVTFQWLHDLVYLPVLIPRCTESILKEQLYFLGIRAPFFTFGETPTLLQNKLIIGFLNSCFCCLPVSCAHIIGLRQYYLQGWRMGLATNAGIVLGNTLFLCAVLFGWRGVLIPWLQFEPWNYVLGCLILVLAIREFYLNKESAKWLRHRFGGDQKFFRTGFYAFALTLCDQSFIFQHLSNLTLGLETNFIEPLTGTSHGLFFQHIWYILGFVLGSVVFTCVFFQCADGVRYLVTRVNWRMPTMLFSIYFSRFSYFYLIITAAATLPFYGVDYLVTRPLGFVPYDTGLTPSIFVGYTIQDRFLENLGVPVKGEKFFPEEHDEDVAGFDRGVYLHRTPYDFTGTPDMRGIESFRIPIEEYWRTRFRRRTDYRPIFHLKEGRKKQYRRIIEKFSLLTRLADQKEKRTQATLQSILDDLRPALETDAKRKEKSLKMVTYGVDIPFDQFTITDNFVLPFDAYKKDLSTNVSNAYKKFIRRLRTLLTKPTLTKKDEYNLANLLEDVDFQIDNAQNTPRENFYKDVKKAGFNLFLGRDFRPKRYDPEKYYISPTITQKLHLTHPNDDKGQKILHYRMRKNPYFVNLLRTDIDGFLARQPQSHTLTSKEEAELFYKRSMMNDYYNTMRRYRYMFEVPPAYFDFLDGYGSTKSFAHKVFNHQFNGTYRMVRRIMSIDLNPVTNPEQRRVVKFDMPLFDDSASGNPMLHEELEKRIETKVQKRGATSRIRRAQRRSKRSFFRGSNTHPLYAGWDEQKRQFVLTNRLLPTALTGRRIRVPTEYKEFKQLAGFAEEKREQRKIRRKLGSTRTQINFTLWPIQKQMINDPLLWKTRRGVYANDNVLHHASSFPVLPEETTQEKATTQETPNKSSPKEENREIRLPRGVKQKKRTFFPKQKEAKIPRKNQLAPSEIALRDRYFVMRFLPGFDFSKTFETFFSSLMVLPDQGKEEDIARLKQEVAINIDKEIKRIGSSDEFVIQQWPSGLRFTRPDDEFKWWLEEDPPPPFADRGGFVWPGHENLKFDIKTYVPQIHLPKISSRAFTHKRIRK